MRDQPVHVLDGAVDHFAVVRGRLVIGGDRQLLVGKTAVSEMFGIALGAPRLGVHQTVFIAKILWTTHRVNRLPSKVYFDGVPEPAGSVQIGKALEEAAHPVTAAPRRR